MVVAAGRQIVDQTDDLPHKGHFIHDQQWFATVDAIDTDVVDPLADGRLSKEAASMRARTIIAHAARTAWQCSTCGRLYIDGPGGQVCCFAPESEPPEHEVFRGGPSQA